MVTFYSLIFPVHSFLTVVKLLQSFVQCVTVMCHFIGSMYVMFVSCKEPVYQLITICLSVFLPLENVDLIHTFNQSKLSSHVLKMSAD